MAIKRLITFYNPPGTLDQRDGSHLFSVNNLCLSLSNSSFVIVGEFVNSPLAHFVTPVTYSSAVPYAFGQRKLFKVLFLQINKIPKTAITKIPIDIHRILFVLKFISLF